MTKTIALDTLTTFCNQYLNSKEFKDYCPNGLQVEGKPIVQKVIGGVTASLALINKAIELNADAIIVHHGYFWKGEPEVLTGMKGQRIKKLMQNDISLLAYHLPLDQHAIVGNNIALINTLDLSYGEHSIAPTNPLLHIITLNHPYTVANLSDVIAHKLHREPLVLLGGSHLITKIGLCTGAAQSMLTEAAALGCDAFISGEVSEKTTHEAQELGIHYFAAGHHATEKGGIIALGEVLKRELDIAFTFVDILNPV